VGLLLMLAGPAFGGGAAIVKRPGGPLPRPFPGSFGSPPARARGGVTDRSCRGGDGRTRRWRGLVSFVERTLTCSQVCTSALFFAASSSARLGNGGEGGGRVSGFEMEHVPNHKKGF
jgi:hypothetical protein